MANYVYVKSLHNRSVVFGKYGRVEPGKTLEVSLFDYVGSIKNDPYWELISTPQDIPEATIVQEDTEAKTLTEEAVKEVRKKSKSSKSRS